MERVNRDAVELGEQLLAKERDKMKKVEVTKETLDEICELLREMRSCRGDMLQSWRYNKDQQVLNLLVHLSAKSSRAT